jgi:hypothetical protein
MTVRNVLFVATLVLAIIATSVAVYQYRQNPAVFSKAEPGPYRATLQLPESARGPPHPKPALIVGRRAVPLIVDRTPAQVAADHAFVLLLLGGAGGRPLTLPESVGRDHFAQLPHAKSISAAVIVGPSAAASIIA